MLYFKSCPKCKTGTIQLDSDFYGSFITCLNCGFEKSAASVRKIDFERVKAEAEAVEEKTPVAVGAEDRSEDDDYEEDDYEDDDDDFVELERAAG